MPRYELVEGTSNKFWEIDVKKASYTARWGRIGAASHNEKTQAFASAAEATKAHDKLVAEKLKKGYQLAGTKPKAGTKPSAKTSDAAAKAGTKPKPGAKTPDAAAKAGKPKVGATAPAAKVDGKLVVNPKLEAGIAEHPDDIASWQVYADWLLENGAPWGEVIARACAKKVARKEQQLAEAAMLGGIPGATMKWKYGAVESLELCPDEYYALTHPDYQGKTLDQYPMPLALGRVLAHPAGRLVRKLVLGLPPMAGETDYSFNSIIPVIAKHGPLPLLEAVDMSRNAKHMDQDSWRWVGDLRPLWKAAPRLKELKMMGSAGYNRKRNFMGDIVAPHLEKLVFESSGLEESVALDIGRAKLPALRELRLYFGRLDYGNSCAIRSLAGILAGKGMPKLDTLGLENSEWEAELIEAVAKSAILPRLQHLSFSMGILYHDGPAALIKHAAKFRHLKTLDLGENYIDDLKALKAVLPNVSKSYQRELDDADEPSQRYTSVGE